MLDPGERCVQRAPRYMRRRQTGRREHPGRTGGPDVQLREPFDRQAGQWDGDRLPRLGARTREPPQAGSEVELLSGSAH
jgi:hypothetical protein